MVIVLGGTGFVGMYTVDELVKHGKRVVATGRNKALEQTVRSLGAEFVQLDVCVQEDFDKLPTDDVEGVIILAGLLPANAHADLIREDNAADYFRVNVIGHINALEWCRKHNVRKFLSSCSYSDTSGAWGKGYAITEEEPRDFNFTGDHAVYVISHNAANDVMEYYNQQHGMQCCWFRFPPVYGVGPHGTILVNGKPYKSGVQTFIERAAAGEDIELWGDPHIKRDIVYVKDVARAYRLALGSDNALGLYNMTSGTQLDLQEQAEIIIDVFGEGKGSKITYRPDKPNATPSFLYSMEKAKRDFGFVPAYVDYRSMMEDYKKELESGRWSMLSSRQEE